MDILHFKEFLTKKNDLTTISVLSTKALFNMKYIILRSITHERMQNISVFECKNKVQSRWQTDVEHEPKMYKKKHRSRFDRSFALYLVWSELPTGPKRRRILIWTKSTLPNFLPNSSFQTDASDACRRVYTIWISYFTSGSFLI